MEEERSLIERIETEYCNNFSQRPISPAEHYALKVTMDEAIDTFDATEMPIIRDLMDAADVNNDRRPGRHYRRSQLREEQLFRCIMQEVYRRLENSEIHKLKKKYYEGRKNYLDPNDRMVENYVERVPGTYRNVLQKLIVQLEETYWEELRYGLPKRYTNWVLLSEWEKERETADEDIRVRSYVYEKMLDYIERKDDED